MSAEVENLIARELKEKSFLVARELDRLIRQQISTTQLLSQTQTTLNAIKKPNNAGLKYITDNSEVIVNLHIVTSSGKVLVSTAVDFKIKQQPGAKALQKLLNSASDSRPGQIFLSNARLVNNNASILFINKINNPELSQKHLLILEFSLKTIDSIIADFSERVVGNKSVFVVSQYGDIISSGHPEFNALDQFPDLLNAPSLLSAFQQKHENSHEVYEDYQQDKVLAAYAHMDSFGENQALNWTIIAIAPLQNIFEPVFDITQSLLWLCLVTIVVSVLIALIASEKLTSPLRRLTTMAGQLQRGDYQAQANINGPAEVEILANSLNLAAQKIDEKEVYLQLAKQQADQANQAKSEFLTNMAHELRTPLNSIIGFTQRILKKDRDSLKPRSKDALETVIDNGLHLLSLINDLLDLSKIESGHIQLKLEKCHLASLFSDIESQFIDQADEKNLQLLVNLEHDYVVCVDQKRLYQVLINLVSNALTHTQQGKVQLSASVNSQGIKVAIADTGAGIDEQLKQRLFDKFEQANHKKVDGRGGTGLGLALVREILELHNSKIQLDSQLGMGSCFYFYLEDFTHAKALGIAV